MKIKRVLICFLCLPVCFCFSLACTVTSYASDVSLNVEYHSKSEITEYLKNCTALKNARFEYEEEPKLNEPYSQGSLSEKTLDDCIKILNTVRYIAGLGSVSLYSEITDGQQAGCLVNALNGVISHYPERPSGISDELFVSGSNACKASNIAMGYPTPYSAIVHGWMADEDDGNIDCIGHRRWCLNPTMKKTSFGYVAGYSSMYAVDRSGYDTEKTVAWPAQTMPIEYFRNDYPWSLSLGKTVNSDSVSVLLERNDGRIWYFSAGKSDGHFNVNNDNYGQTGCIIFRPDDIEYNDGDTFTVTVKTDSETLKYQVEFFDPDACLFTLGDIDNDGNITSADARLALRASVRLENLTKKQQNAADVDNSGKIESSDARLILRVSVNLDVFPSHIAEDEQPTAPDDKQPSDTQNTVTIDKKELRIGMTLNEITELFGPPSGKDSTAENTETYSFAGDPAKYFMAYIQNGKAIAFYIAAKDFVCGKYKQGDSNIPDEILLADNTVATPFTDICSNSELYAVLLIADSSKLTFKTEESEYCAQASKQIFDITNAFRIQKGIAPLKQNEKLSYTAQKHSEAMARNNLFSHTMTDGKDLSERMTESGINWYMCAENIAAGRYVPFLVADQWISSSGHRKNILGNYEYTGIGGGTDEHSCYKFYWTQDFASVF